MTGCTVNPRIRWIVCFRSLTVARRQRDTHTDRERRGDTLQSSAQSHHWLTNSNQMQIPNLWISRGRTPLSPPHPLQRSIVGKCKGAVKKKIKLKTGLDWCSVGQGAGTAESVHIKTRHKRSAGFPTLTTGKVAATLKIKDRLFN